VIRAPLELPLWVGAGEIVQRWRRWVQDITAAGNAANAAAPASSVPSNSRRINPGAGLLGGGNLGADVTISLYRIVDVVANLPTDGNTIGQRAFATDACNAGEATGAGTGCGVEWNGSLWRIPGVSTAVTA